MRSRKFDFDRSATVEVEERKVGQKVLASLDEAHRESTFMRGAFKLTSRFLSTESVLLLSAWKRGGFRNLGCGSLNIVCRCTLSSSDGVEEFDNFERRKRK